MFDKHGYPLGSIKSDKKVYYRKLGWRVYQIESPFFIQTSFRPDKLIQTANGRLALTLNGVLCMMPGYVSDGSSGPTIQTKSSFRGAFAHDGGYRFMRRGRLPVTTRVAWDDLILKLCLEDGMWGWRGNGWYKSLRKFGGKNADPKNVCPVLCAP